MRSLYLVFSVSCLIGCSSHVGDKLQSEGTLEENTLFHQGLKREYLLYAPTGAKSDAPMVVVMHGYTSNMHDIASYVGMNELADEHNFLVSYPEMPDMLSAGNRKGKIPYSQNAFKVK